MRTIIEPFRIKVVEPIRQTTFEERELALRAARYNVFALHADDILIDLLTDSGTGAMSQHQWAGVMQGDESYAGSRSYFRFRDAIADLFGPGEIIPTHQGRAAERILFGIVGGQGKVIPNNTHFDTTRANAEYSGAKAVDVLCPEGSDPFNEAPFKGNVDLVRLEAVIREAGPENVPLVMVTVTNNAGGGQPVSLENLRAVRELTARFGIPLYLDACRFAENAWFIREREPGHTGRTPKAIAQEMFSLCDGATMSAKKDGLANMGGFLATRDRALADEARNLLILTEGFPTYGGLSGRDLEAIARGLEEVVDPDYLGYRIASTAYLCDKLHAQGVPVVRPAGGHAVYLDAARFADHLPRTQLPAQSVTCGLYLLGGVRGCEMGAVMFGRGAELPKMELVRLAIPRRVYTQSHIDYVVEAIVELYGRRRELSGYRIAWEPPRLRHFTCHFEQIPKESAR
jgi:tyrosine phenol-lyase